MRKQRIISSGSGRRAQFPAASGAKKFTDLTDVPQSYSGQGGKILTVKGAENGIEFNTEAAIDRHDVKGSAGDLNPQFLDSKVDNATIEVSSDALQLKNTGHALAGGKHASDTITHLQSKLTDGSLITSKAAEISALTAKSPVDDTDLLLIEDAASGNAKKKIVIGDLKDIYCQVPVISIYDNSGGTPQPPPTAWVQVYSGGDANNNAAAIG